ncbi:MAG: hypothetical protein ACYTFG_01960 [Planctomycetota bacterium]|jgi:predicted  nucleic acid-binding Zn-ribbon protein
MKGTLIRLALALVVASAAYAAVFLLAMQEGGPVPANPETISVEVRDPENDPWVEEERRRIAAEKQRQAELKQALEAEAARIAEKRRALEEDLKKVRTTADDLKPREKDLAEREETVDRIEAKLKQSRAEHDKRLEDLKARESKAEADRQEISRRQADLEALAETLLNQQKELAERTENIEKKESTLESREAEAKELAKVLMDRQKEIQDRQEDLEKTQRNLSDSQTDRDKEWKKIQDEWKKIEDQRKALESKLSSAKTTAKDWAALKSEWKKLEDQRKKLEETQEVRENVGRFEKQFDRGSYEEGLTRVKRNVSLAELKEGHVPFDFRFYTDQQALDHLGYFGIVDLYLNQKTNRYLTVKNYRAGDFADKGNWDPEIQQEIAGKFAPFLIRRKVEKRRTFFSRAERQIGSGVNIWGLIPNAMFYEIYYHKKRVLQAYSLSNDDLASFEIAPWRDRGSGRWMFKIIRVRKTDGRTLKIGNYSFS